MATLYWKGQNISDKTWLTTSDPIIEGSMMLTDSTSSTISVDDLYTTFIYSDCKYSNIAYSHIHSKSDANNDAYSCSYKTYTAVCNHVEGFNGTRAVGSSYSHAEGDYAMVNSCNYGYAEGYQSYASTYSLVFNGDGSNRSSITGDTIFAVGMKDSENDYNTNLFRVTDTGYAFGQYYSTYGADYAEYISEWYDGNKDNEDRVGYFVTIKDNKLYKANSGDYIVGITSGNPSVVGNGDEDYFYRYKRDNMNRILYEDVELERGVGIDENGNQIYETVTESHPVQRDEYDPSLTYISRSDRPEWDYVGMIGTLPVYDDGTCEVNGYCKCGDDGIGTKCDTYIEDESYFVLERIADNIIKVILKI